ncbi:MAG: YdaU family protein [Methylobacter sp.]
MNYYERHLGDYAKDTAHLSLLEHGAYSLLLDRYYGTEKGIPQDQAHRVSRARSKEEKAAVDAVLDEFFTLVDGVYINQRAEEEITKAQSKIKAAQENGKRGGRPKNNQVKTQEKPSGLFSGYETVTQKKAPQTPDTNHQSPEKEYLDTHNNLTTDGELTPGSVCVLLRSLGIASVNPSHPDLLAVIADGATPEQFNFAASEAVGKGKGFAYLIAIVKNQIIENRDNHANKNNNAARIGTGRKLSLAEQAERDIELLEEQERRERVLN